MGERGWRVLVIEDERDGREVMRDIMEMFGIDCDAAPTAEEGLRLLSSQTYTAAIIDLSLPGMNGFDLVAKIRTHPDLTGLPCMAYTAYHTSKVKQEALEAGFNAYCAKPAYTSELIEQLEQIIKASST